jgi:AcrR family transcriptional regulator
VAAARELMSKDGAPSMPEVARRALVSEATAYRYFPTRDALLREAAMAPLVSALESAVAEAEAQEDAEAGLDLFVSTVFRELREKETAFRLLLGSSLSAPPTEGLREEIERGVGRGGRRPGWIRRVLTPARAAMDDETFERLVRAITAAIGIEALAALRDVCHLSLDECEDVMRWSAVALLREATRSATRRQD